MTDELLDCTAFSRTLQQVAADVLGEPTASSLLVSLKTIYNIRFEKTCSSQSEIEAALVDIFGSAAEPLIDRIRSVLCC